MAAPTTGMAAAQNGGLLTPVSASLPAAPEAVVRRFDKRAEEMLARQITEPGNPNAGGYPDATEIVTPHSGSGVISVLGTVWLCPASRFHRDPELLRRLRLAAAFLERKQLPSGNIDLMSTNFNSPPDTGFVVHAVAPAAILARRAGEAELVRMLMPFLQKAGKGMAAGGVHTPNHRWVVASALALVHHLEPGEALLRRIHQWLAEGIDIDDDGLYTERSPLVYSPVVNLSLIFLAEFLNRPELLEPVRRNLNAALYLMHANGELVTELSGRQDQNTTGYMGVNWLGLQYLAERDGNGVFAHLARKYEDDYTDLGLWMLLPALQSRKTSPEPPPQQYRKIFRNAHLHRIANGKRSITVIAQGNDRLLTIRSGAAVVEAVRFAGAFFGKGQFIPTESSTGQDSISMSQSLVGPYFQPFDPPEKIPSDPEVWGSSRRRRKQSEVAQYRQSCTLRLRESSLEMEIAAEGTPNVPVAVEIGIRNGVTISGVRTAPQSPEAFLTTGEPVLLSAEGDSLRIEAPASVHGYTQLRGALPKLPGRSVYLAGFSPFRETIVFRF